MTDYSVIEIMIVIRAMTNQGMRPRIHFISKLCGLSEKKFTKKFVDLYGLTPDMMIDTLLVKKSTQDLVGTSMSVKKIAESYMFKKTSHYMDAFFNLYGVTPEEYRHMYRGDVKDLKDSVDDELTDEIRDLLDSMD